MDCSGIIWPDSVIVIPDFSGCNNFHTKWCCDTSGQLGNPQLYLKPPLSNPNSDLIFTLTHCAKASANSTARPWR